MRRYSVGREITIGLVVYAVYLLVRRLVLRSGGRARAHENGERIVAVERRLGIDVEPALQLALVRYPRVVQGLNVGYALFNVSLTMAWLVALYRRRDPKYHRLRRACVVCHLAAQPVFFLFPTAPPRALDGFVDTMSEMSGVDLESPLLVRFYNPVAAMPSLHVAFATMTGAAIADRAETRTGKAAAYAYAPLVALVVAGTGNHYVLDSVAGAALGAVVRKLV